MDWWVVPLIISLLFSFTLNLFLSRPKAHKNLLPPGPRYIPIVTPLSFLTKNVLDIEAVLRRLRQVHGPILTLRVASRPQVFISDRALAHRALVELGSSVSDRLPANPSGRILRSNHRTVSSSPYGPLWRSLRRNLSSQILHPSRLKHFTGARNRTLGILLDDLRRQHQSDASGSGVVMVKECFEFAMFCLLVLMCFGDQVDVGVIKQIEDLQKTLHKSFSKLSVFAIFPRITKIVFWKRWNWVLDFRRKQEQIFLPLIKAAPRAQQQKSEGTTAVPCNYVDSLIELSIPGDGGGRKLNDGEIVSLCSEFLSAGTDTTATALEWTMAELVKNQDVQRKLFEEIEQVVPAEEYEVKEEYLPRMSYLKGVILEGLRRHPPAHFVLPHVVTEDIELGGYVVPKDAAMNFTVAEMGWDEKVWKDPMRFRPERFLEGGEGKGVDITGSREIKMMPFGAGRRICPGLGLAMLHLEYFVANLVREFEWKGVEGEEIDLSEELELTVVMKNHLRARIVPRRETMNGKM